MKNLAWIIIIILFGCKSDNKRPDDFQFQLIGKIDSYDSETGRFKRDYISFDPITDTVVIENLTQSELDSAWRILTENDFFSLPETFECDKSIEYTVIVPSFSSTILVKSNSRTKRVSYNDGCSPKIDLKAERNFKTINKQLKKLVYTKNSIKNLPDTEIVFL